MKGFKILFTAFIFGFILSCQTNNDAKTLKFNNFNIKTMAPYNAEMKCDSANIKVICNYVSNKLVSINYLDQTSNILLKDSLLYIDKKVVLYHQISLNHVNYTEPFVLDILTYNQGGVTYEVALYQYKSKFYFVNLAELSGDSIYESLAINELFRNKPFNSISEFLKIKLKINIDFYQSGNHFRRFVMIRNDSNCHIKLYDIQQWDLEPIYYDPYNQYENTVNKNYGNNFYLNLYMYKISTSFNFVSQNIEAIVQ